MTSRSRSEWSANEATEAVGGFESYLGLSQLLELSGNNLHYQEELNNQKGAEDLCRRTNPT